MHHPMYTRVNTIDQLKERAEVFVLENDRMLYAPFLSCVEQFCHDEQVLIGGDVGVDLLVHADDPHIEAHHKPTLKLNKDQFVWDLYASDAYRCARKLADALAQVKSPHVPARTVALQTNIKHREFTMYVNTRVLLRIYAMERYRGVDLASLAGTARVTGALTGVSIASISAEMHLIQLYRRLYSPSMISSAVDNLMMEASLFSIMRAGSIPSESVIGAAESKHTDKIIAHIAADTNTVFIGAFAIRGDKSRLQVITNDVDVLYSAISRIVPGTRLVKYNLGIVGDFQLTKHTVYASGGGHNGNHNNNNTNAQSPLMDIFNSAQYEMIPFVAKAVRGHNIRAAGPWVLLRYLFIDIWVLKMVGTISGDSAAYQSKIDHGMGLINEVRVSALADLPSTFQLNNYIGIFMDETIAKKKMIRDTGDRFPTYYPAKGSEKTGGGSNGGGDTTWKRKNNSNGGKHYYKEYSGCGDTNNANNTNDAEDPLCVPLGSAAINLSLFPADKRRILVKITGDNGKDMPAVLANYRVRTSNVKWGANKSVEKEIAKNAQFVPFAPKQPRVCLDIGCGSGIVLDAFKQQYNITCAYGADIEDSRANPAASTFVPIVLGSPIDLPDASVDIITMFHVAHHMVDSPADRFRDIARLLRPGGVFMFKDHDVRDVRTASNVDFEHFAYLVGEVSTRIDTLMSDFATELPMSYCSADTACEWAADAGLTLLWRGKPYGMTAIYSAVWVRV